MATNDIRSDLLPRLAFNANISTDTTTAGAIIDTADVDGGVSYELLAQAWTDGTYTPLLEESDDSGMSGATAVPDENLIGTEAGAAVSALTAAGAVLTSFGAFGTKRYLRLSIVSTGTSTGADIVAVFNGVPEIKPDPALSA